MVPIPTREDLEAMKRADLQKLCKDFGVKANLKTEALIDLLLNEVKPPPPPPQRSVSRRVSSRIGSRPRGRSGGSVIVHETDDEQDTDGELVFESEQPEPQPQPPPGTVPYRSRKAKESQKRLGVGRPIIAGGSGARAVTKPPSLSNQKRGKSRGMKPTEATIQEEPEPEITDISSQRPNHPPEPDPSVPRREPTHVETAQRLPVPDSNTLPSMDVVERHVVEALKPIQDQLESLKSELGQLPSLSIDNARFNATVTDNTNLHNTVKTLSIAIDEIRTQFNTLSADVKQLRDLITTSTQIRAPLLPNPLGSAFQSSSKRTSGASTLPFGIPSSLKSPVLHPSSQIEGEHVPVASTSKSALPHPGFAPSMLGKRHRDSTTSNVTGVFDEEQEVDYTEAELATRVSRPSKKKARLSHGYEDIGDGDGNSGSPRAAQSQDSRCQSAHDEGEGPISKSRVPSFTVFSGPEEPPGEYIDPPPPTNLLPESFAPSSPPASRLTTTTAHATENQNPFTFPFLQHATATQSTFPMNLPNFPIPEPPQSPSPSGPSTDQRAPGGRQDTSIFQNPFVVPPRTRSGIREPGGGFIDPAALIRPPDRPLTSNDIAAGLGLTSVHLENDGREQNLPPIKRTMYGTELEDDTRFGDFGVEGVSSGFWAGGRY